MFGGTLSFYIGPPPRVTLNQPHTVSSQNSHAAKLARELDEQCTLQGILRHDLSTSRETRHLPEPSDRVEEVRLMAKWEAAPGALGIRLPPGSLDADSEHIAIVSHTVKYPSSMRITNITLSGCQ